MRLNFKFISSLFFLGSLISCQNQDSEFMLSEESDYVNINTFIQTKTLVSEFSEGDCLVLSDKNAPSNQSEYFYLNNEWKSKSPLMWREIIKDNDDLYHFIAIHNPLEHKSNYKVTGSNMPDMLAGISVCKRNEEPSFQMKHVMAQTTFQITLSDELEWNDGSFITINDIYTKGYWHEDGFLPNESEKKSDIRMNLKSVSNRIVETNSVMICQPIESIKIEITGASALVYNYTFSQPIQTEAGANTVIKISLNKKDIDLIFESALIQPWEDGKSEEIPVIQDADTIYIYNESQLLRLKEMSEIMNNSFAGKTIILKENIKLTEEVQSYFGVKRAFEGTFDGNNKTITGYTATKDLEEIHTGFFSQTKGAVIKDFNLDVKIESDLTDYYVGGLVGYAAGNTEISNTNVTGSIRSVGNTGSIAGYSNSTINRCYSEVAMIVQCASQGKFIGGICSVNDGFVIATTNNSFVDLRGTNCYLGGIAGRNNRFIVSCENKESLINSTDIVLYTGMFAGYNTYMVYGCWGSKSSGNSIGTSTVRDTYTEGNFSSAILLVTDVSMMNSKVSYYNTIAIDNGYPEAPYWSFRNGSAILN